MLVLWGDKKVQCDQNPLSNPNVKCSVETPLYKINQVSIDLVPRTFEKSMYDPPTLTQSMLFIFVLVHKKHILLKNC
jgi:hypothetical protein